MKCRVMKVGYICMIIYEISDIMTLIHLYIYIFYSQPNDSNTHAHSKKTRNN